MSYLPESWFVLRGYAKEFLGDLAECSKCATVDLDHLSCNLYYMRLGRAVRRTEVALTANAVDRSALCFVALHRELTADQPTGPDSSSFPNHIFSSAQKLERDFLNVASSLPLPAAAAAPFRELTDALSKSLEEVAYTERDRETGEVDAIHAIDPAGCFGVGQRLARLEEYLHEGNYGSAFEFVEELFRDWLDRNCPQYLKRNDEALKYFSLNAAQLFKENDDL